MKIGNNEVLIGIAALGVGIVIGRRMAQKMITIPDPDVAKLGDKSNDVAMLQHTMNYFVGRDLVEETGTYDKPTADAARTIFAETSALRDADSGSVDLDFIRDFRQVVANVQQNKNTEA